MYLWSPGMVTSFSSVFGLHHCVREISGSLAGFSHYADWWAGSGMYQRENSCLLQPYKNGVSEPEPETWKTERSVLLPIFNIALALAPYGVWGLLLKE